MRPDDVKGALNALASEQPAPTGDAATVVARGCRRVAQRRLAFIGVAAVLITAVVVVGTISVTRHKSDVVSTVDPVDVGTPRASSQFPSALEGWKCGNPLQYTDDGGESWRKISLPTGRPAGYHDLGLCTALPGGNAWTTWMNADGTEWHLVRIRNLTDIKTFRLPPVPATDPNASLTFVDVNHGWFLTGLVERTKSLYRTTDGGATWTLASKSAPIRSGVTFADAHRGWSFNGRTLVGTTDGGTTWHGVAIPAPAGAPRNRVTPVSVFAQGDSVVVWSGTDITRSQLRPFFDVSNDGGETWFLRSGPEGFELPGVVNNVFGPTDGSHWALASGAELRITDDGGRTWQTRPDLPVAEGKSLAYPMVFPTPDVGWINTDDGLTWRTTDSGRTWTNITNGGTPSPTTSTATTTPRSTPTVQPSAQLAFASATEGWICENPLAYTTDGFETVSESVQIPPTPAEPLDYHQEPLCAAVAGGDAWLLRGSGDPDQPEVVRIRERGADVQTFHFAKFLQGTVVSMTFVDANDGWALVMHNGTRPRDLRDLYRTRDGGETWSLLLRDAPVGGSLDFDTAQRGWATAAEGAGLVTTTDGGRTWRTVKVPTPTRIPGMPMGIGTVQVQGDVIVAFGGATTGNFFNPFFDLSEDGGKTWSLRDGPTALPGTLENAFNAADANHWALGFAYHFYITANGGKTWTERPRISGIDTIYDIALVDANVAFTSGIANPSTQSTVVLRSVDGGRSWKPVDGQLPPG